MRRHFAAFMPRKSLDIRTTDYPCDREKGLTALFPASGEDGSGQGPANGSRDWSLVGFGARPQGLKPSISAIFKVLLSLFFSARFFIDYLTLPSTVSECLSGFHVLCSMILRHPQPLLWNHTFSDTLSASPQSRNIPKCLSCCLSRCV